MALIVENLKNSSFTIKGPFFESKLHFCSSISLIILLDATMFCNKKKTNKLFD